MRRAQVYDVTKFLEDHPGGSEILVTSTGRDATEDFEDVVHSRSAIKQLDEYYIGELDESDRAAAKSAGPAFGANTATAAKSDPGPISTFVKAILPFLFAALAYMYYANVAGGK